MNIKQSAISGVYTIRNRVTGSVYVGSSLNVEERIKDHMRRLRRNAHYCKELQDDWIRHGERSFAIGLVAEVPIEFHPTNEWWERPSETTESRILRRGVENEWMMTLLSLGVHLYSKNSRYIRSRGRRQLAHSYWQSNRQQAA